MIKMINWKEQSEGDYIAIEGDYMLRVEQMNKMNWWWCVYFEEEEIDSGNSLIKITAMVMCLNTMNKHLKLK